MVGERGRNNAPDGRGGEYPPKQRVHFFGRWHLVTGGILVAMGMVGDGVWGGRGQQI